ncbi:MAG: preprotein translocase subunit SecG [Polyangiaceae bacterium]|nr:preprotein translocase subunit SecG [Polyangiaceae bacterium]
MSELLRTPFTVVHVVACLFLMLVILIQPGKSGGMGALTSGAAQQVFGGGGAGNLLTKVTWITGGIFFITSVSLAYMSTSSDSSLERRAAAARNAGTSKDKAPAKKSEPEKKPPTK